MEETTAVDDMPRYERELWGTELAYWAGRADARGTPRWLAEGTKKVAGAAVKGGKAVANALPEPVREAAGTAADATIDVVLRPSITAALRVLELANDWAVELQDPARVVELAQRHHPAVTSLADVRGLAVKDCDRLLTRHTLKWRTAGMVEGAAMGALALVPIAGMPLAIAADTLVIDLLTVSVATRVAYSYGFDAKDPSEREFIAAVIRTALGNQLTKAAPLNAASRAHQAAWKRQRWSSKLREDQRLIAALEKFMATWYKNGKVPVAHVGKALGVLAVLVGAGANAYTLGRVAEHTRHYCRTRRLCEDFGLPLPPTLAPHHPDGFARDTRAATVSDVPGSWGEDA